MPLVAHTSQTMFNNTDGPNLFLGFLKLYVTMKPRQNVMRKLYTLSANVTLKFPF